MISGGYISYGTETYKVFPTSTVFSLNPHFNLTLARENAWRGFDELIMLVLEIQINTLVLRET
jgi:hypothetical protein